MGVMIMSDEDFIKMVNDCAKMMEEDEEEMSKWTPEKRKEIEEMARFAEKELAKIYL